MRFLSWFDRVCKQTQEEKNRSSISSLLSINANTTCAFFCVLKFYSGSRAKWKATENSRLSDARISVVRHSRSTTPPLRTRQRQSAQPESFNTLRQTFCESLKKTFSFSPPFLLRVYVCVSLTHSLSLFPSLPFPFYFSVRFPTLNTAI